MSQSDSTQPIDIVTRLNQTRADMLGTDDEDHYWDCHEAAGEIERLRSQPCPYVTGTVTRYCTLTPFTLTDAEREAIERARQTLNAVQDLSPTATADDAMAAATLRGLLERTKG
jgi:hypothetical protein